jgi:predicted ferric reductase
MGSLSRAAWIAFYLVLALAPLLVAVIISAPPGNGFGWDFAIALGIGAFGLMGAMLLLTARFRRAAAPFGVDVIFYFHRQIGIAILGVALLHPLILLWLEPTLWHYLKPEGPGSMHAGAGALVALALLVGSSVARKALHLHYDLWRKAHAVLAVTALALGVVHVAGINYYFSAPAMRLLLVLLALLWAALVIYVRVIRPVQLWRRPYVVESVTPERGRAWTLTLSPSGHSGFRFLPGQFAWLTIGNGPWSMQEHPFSIVSSAQQPGRVAFTIKALGDFTSTVGAIAPGQTAYVDGPYGAFSPDRHDATGLVLIAGGIGMAPLLCMLRTLADRGDQRPIMLVYAYRDLDNLTFREELESLEKRLRLRTVIVLREPPADWSGERGMLTPEMFVRHLPADCRRCQYYVCGPQPMLDVVETALRKAGVSLGRMHFEIFDWV